MAEARRALPDGPAIPALLAVEGLQGWYGEGHVLHGIGLEVRPGEVVTLVGRNGAGRTTTLRAIMGILGRRAGSIRHEGVETISMTSRTIARRGIGYVPEERGIFAGLTVAENLMLPPVVRPGGLSVAEVHALFPNLRERAGSPGTRLSGGEQQMLAIGRILRTGAKLILLDEPTEGLAPAIVSEIARTVAGLKARGFTILLVEGNLRFARAVADRHVVIEEGRTVDVIANADLDAGASRLTAYLGV